MASGRVDRVAASTAGSSSGKTKQKVLSDPVWLPERKQPVRAAELQHQVTFWWPGDDIRKLLELGDEEAIHVVCVGVEAPRQLERGVEGILLEPEGGHDVRSENASAQTWPPRKSPLGAHLVKPSLPKSRPVGTKRTLRFFRA